MNCLLNKLSFFFIHFLRFSDQEHFIIKKILMTHNFFQNIDFKMHWRKSWGICFFSEQSHFYGRHRGIICNAGAISFFFCQ